MVRAAPFFTPLSGIFTSSLCVLMMLSSGYAAECDQSLKPIPGQAGYTSRHGRCEGLYVSPVSAQTLELISLLRGQLLYRLAGQERLWVTVPDLPKPSTGPVHVRAVARPLKTYYRMDADVSPGQRMAWPVGEVLLPLRLDASRLGAYGWVETDQGPLFVPLRIASQKTTPPAGAIEVVVRSTVDVEGLVWRLAAEGKTPLAWRKGGANIAAGESVTLTLPQGQRAILHLEIAAKAENRDQWSKLRLRVLRD